MTKKEMMGVDTAVTSEIETQGWSQNGAGT